MSDPDGAMYSTRGALTKTLHSFYRKQINGRAKLLGTQSDSSLFME